MLRAARIAALMLAACAPALAQFTQQNNGAQAPTPSGSVGYANGHVIFNCAGPPTLTNGTLLDGSNDCQGNWTSSSTSGVMTFANPYVRAPMCDVTAYSGTQPTYSVSPQAITISTEVNGSQYTYQCIARPGG